MDDRPGNDIVAALGLWRETLVSLTGTNRLINFKQSKTGTVQIVSPTGTEILTGLKNGAVWALLGSQDEEDEASDVLRQPALPVDATALARVTRPDNEVGPVLRNLMRRSNQEYVDRGLSVLYLALGMLRWHEPDGTAQNSPLLLVPVRLAASGPRQRPLLRIGDDDPVLNPALTLRLQEFGITLPAVDDLADLDLGVLLDQVGMAVGERSGWHVTASAVISCFSFHKEAMYRDLLDNEDRVLAHPIVRAIAQQDPTGQTRDYHFDDIRPTEIDQEAPPESTPLVLDADSSQRACIAAALAGRSFVMDGPPGTGKSQTIANMIGALLHAGKTVLFVSEKAAALEVVRNRLAAAGLENYLLELHSHKASRKEVAAALAHALDNVPVPPPGMDPVSRRTLVERRQQLNAYAEAMNKVREPLGFSLHHVLGLIAALDHVPAAPLPACAPAELDPESLQAIRATAGRIARAWRPASQGQSFLWRGVTERASLEARLFQARSSVERLDGMTRVNRELAEAFEIGRPDETPVLVALAAQQAGRPSGVPDEWLRVPDFGTVTSAAAALTSELVAFHSAARAASDQAGVDWTDLPDPATLPDSPAVASIGPAALDLSGADTATAQQLADRFAEDANRLTDRLQALARLSELMGLPLVRTLTDADNALRLADLAYTKHRPERSWLDPGGLAPVSAAAALLERLTVELTAAETVARVHYTDAAIAAPLTELQERFTNLHKGLGKLRGRYRQDRVAVEAISVPGVTIEVAVANLPLAIKWQSAHAALASAAADQAACLGGYWQERKTDFTALRAAIAYAVEIVRRSPADSMTGVANYICAANPVSELRTLISGIHADLNRWRSGLVPTPQLGPRTELMLEPFEVAISWLRDHIAPLTAVAVRAGAVSAATGRNLTLAQADELLRLRQSVIAAHDALTASAPSHRASFGDLLYQGVETDAAAVSDALAWAAATRRVRTGVDAVLTDGQVKRLAETRETGNLAEAYASWRTNRDSVVEAFEPSRHLELLAELDDFDSARELIEELRQDSAGQDEWFAYQEARAELAGHQLDGVIDFCIQQGILGGEVPKVIERALLRGWADEIIRTDPALHPLPAGERDVLVERYRELDRQLVPTATSDIIQAVNRRRPERADIGEPARIRREGMKKRRHIPVRQLIGETRRTVLGIKPCFMMSPLAVSQYLPADLSFDVVIFDEASQVTPGDAINCIYRGHALITAGDDRQLPPTSFFARLGEDTDDDDTDIADFQSILELAKASGAFRNLGLRWHYRSRHEALIAFSNQAFYEGKLITFPGAHSDDSDHGVELLPVAGVYGRSGTRDNPIEADQVVKRVLHHYSTRPGLSLGVVTFSVAQADAIQSALDRALTERPDLERHFSTDRLHGFFVKSLEAVQGDERDVMIFSIGYGPDANGKVSTNFGALNRDKGWRRLNVAITRARQRVEIVSSVRAGDIPDSDNESVSFLRGYLDFAERGPAALALDLGPSGRGTDSPFEDSVIDVIRSWGYRVEPQVGAAGYRIDIGLWHPGHPGAFALGIECDGAMYHSAPAARDRDRLREQVLRGLGWNLHRIWGTAWYRNRRHEEERLRAAIVAAVNAPVRGRLTYREPGIERPVVRTAEVITDAVPDWTEPYRTAEVSPLPYWVDKSDASSRYEMRGGVEEIAAVEGPVHVELVRQRLRDAWDIGRFGSKIKTNLDAAIRLADVTRIGDFIDVPDRTVTAVRLPTDKVQRKVEQVSDEELRLAVTRLLDSGGTVAREELMTVVSRMYGWGRLGSEIRGRLSAVIGQLIASGTVTADSIGLHCAPPQRQRTESM
ncbi:DUF3320 domain-containing protein [Solwaraspora sp. WMMA2056]|uniref:DUF3320 domain-containing protein n=1 Tax=Solwaraspora sp. WMMA2056 TaxID=3015161 RepID=UPI00259B54EB|nr:DUF3320 domain-containing protein [Solwaraspora sp. WMMA2056]WJK40109.1 DUF3320 domain-containing protein [Solwaraspora sp. WMMA2056]